MVRRGLTSSGIPLKDSDRSIVIYILRLLSILKKLMAFSFVLRSGKLTKSLWPKRFVRILFGARAGGGPSNLRASSNSTS